MHSYLRIREVLHILPVGRTTLYRLIAAGQFPRPVKFGRASAWPADEVQAALAALREARHG